MPELPEVETTLRGLKPHLIGRKVNEVKVWERRLRWPIPRNLAQQLQGRRLLDIQRRGKYLIWQWEAMEDALLMHLGMSGSLSLHTNSSPRRKHDHFALTFSRTLVLRYHDPRRFGLCLWAPAPVQQHPLLADLGPEPFAAEFNGAYLHQRTRKRRTAVKNVLMDSKIVVGVGNIYASESLFLAGIRPRRGAHRVGLARYQKLAAAVRQVLKKSIRSGGTTLQDFVGGDGQPGYFAQQLHVYGRAGEACTHCGTAIKSCILSQRSSFYCPTCQI